MKSIHLLALAACLSTPTAAQTVLDGAYIREHVRSQRPVPYVHLREADVQWHQRVWRTIDLREKLNHPLYFPTVPSNGRKNLFDAIMSGLKDGAVNAYDPGVLLQDDDFRQAMTADERDAVLYRTDTVWTPSLASPDSLIMVVNNTSITGDRVTQYRLKEDWVFDKQRGKVDVRIIGIAPMCEVRSDADELLGHAPLFWLYYPELRYYLANEEAIVSGNQAQPISYEELFAKRRFSSTITKVSNVHDRSLPAYLTGMDALLSADLIKRDLFTHEHDLWNW